jgi:hypothetical protein
MTSPSARRRDRRQPGAVGVALLGRSRMLSAAAATCAAAGAVLSTAVAAPTVPDLRPTSSQAETDRAMAERADSSRSAPSAGAAGRAAPGSSGVSAFGAIPLDRLPSLTGSHAGPSRPRAARVASAASAAAAPSAAPSTSSPAAPPSGFATPQQSPQPARPRLIGTRRSGGTGQPGWWRGMNEWRLVDLEPVPVLESLWVRITAPDGLLRGLYELDPRREGQQVHAEAGDLVTIGVDANMPLWGLDIDLADRTSAASRQPVPLDSVFHVMDRAVDERVAWQSYRICGNEGSALDIGIRAIARRPSADPADDSASARGAASPASTPISLLIAQANDWAALGKPAAGAPPAPADPIAPAVRLANDDRSASIAAGSATARTSARGLHSFMLRAADELFGLRSSLRHTPLLFIHLDAAALHDQPCDTGSAGRPNQPTLLIVPRVGASVERSTTHAFVFNTSAITPERHELLVWLAGQAEPNTQPGTQPSTGPASVPARLPAAISAEPSVETAPATPER